MHTFHYINILAIYDVFSTVFSYRTYMYALIPLSLVACTSIANTYLCVPRL